MKFLTNEILATSALLSLAGGIFNINSVSAATIGYDLTFFDNLGDAIGFGEFAYNTDTTSCIQEFPVGLPCDEMNGFFVDTELTRFSANISGTQWELIDSAGQLWWDEPTSTVKQAIGGRTEIFLQDRWFFGDNFFGEDILFMEGASGGSWTKVLNTSNNLGGTWIAELRETTSPNNHVIPEPLTLLGTAVAIGFGTFFKTKLK